MSTQIDTARLDGLGGGELAQDAARVADRAASPGQMARVGKGDVR